MRHDELEKIYDALAEAVDAVGPDQSELYLAKLALALAERLGDLSDSLGVIEECKTGLIAQGPGQGGA
ncbi:hypothetical protein M8756_07920 [Lutimaribacter sp. EGI FJ00015]|uniref:Uncharacterized protein n=1 Tax=Lutimaribacter degradans TaxID=2945989 RepID=A0ACC5ZXI6_9RHOB|nr:hypothetical protein [Lutimaribacter sp. EGI FJ00013]MCM2562079.1 hypothetical protein [Lutimaribacter sp. EGI FJ00013]MCO0613232.1 hypothetical protein [Lutimaribacter sp. EGI FJ00015]MCO0636209.1 hypothetical protein [Lutimaribacter sp. EGI FJ00014]